MLRQQHMCITFTNMKKRVKYIYITFFLSLISCSGFSLVLKKKFHFDSFQVLFRIKVLSAITFLLVLSKEENNNEIINSIFTNLTFIYFVY